MAGVTPNGIHYPDGASKAKNLGPELEQMALDIDTYIGSYLRPDGPIRQIVIDLAEDVVPPIVERELAEANVVQAYPDRGSAGYTNLTAVPLSWRFSEVIDPYTDTYRDDYSYTTSRGAQRKGDVPVLTRSGVLYDSVIPPNIARLSDIPEPTPTPATSIMGRRSVRSKFPRFAAGLASRIASGGGAPFVIVGSSTSAAIPGYIESFTRTLQGCYPVSEPSDPLWRRISGIPANPNPGIHVYSAGAGGALGHNYLTDEVQDQIAAISPVAILHMIGSNDYTDQIDPATFESWIRQKLSYFDSVLTQPCQQILVHPYARLAFTPGTYPHSEYLDAFDGIAADRDDTIVVDLSALYRSVGIPGADPFGLIGPDNIHQNPSGYEFMASALADELIN